MGWVEGREGQVGVMATSRSHGHYGGGSSGNPWVVILSLVMHLFPRVVQNFSKGCFRFRFGCKRIQIEQKCT